MAGSGAVLSVGNSLVAYLTAVNALARGTSDHIPASFQLVSSAEIADITTPEAGATVTFWLYRVGVDPYLRNRPAAPRTGAGPVFPLGLDLHYLVTAWAASAAREHEALAWVMRELYRHPVLDRSVLGPADVWHAYETVHLVPIELSTEDMMRIWDAIRPEYRLSPTWCARIDRLDRRVLGAVRLIDGITGRPVARPLTVAADGSRFLRNREALYVIREAPGLAAHQSACEAPPAAPAPMSMLPPSTSIPFVLITPPLRTRRPAPTVIVPASPSLPSPGTLVEISPLRSRFTTPLPVTVMSPASACSAFVVISASSIVSRSPTRTVTVPAGAPFMKPSEAISPRS